jgi:hypothetical protein
MEYWMAASQPDFDPVKTPITVAQAQGMAHFASAMVQYQGCLKERGHWRNLMKLNLDLAKAHPAVHPSLAAGIGYCFGGQCLLDMVRMGADLQGVVSFHGLLQSEPQNALQVRCRALPPPPPHTHTYIHTHARAHTNMHPFCFLPTRGHLIDT